MLTLRVGLILERENDDRVSCIAAPPELVHLFLLPTSFLLSSQHAIVIEPYIDLTCSFHIHRLRESRSDISF